MKRPWVKFFPADWRADPKLRSCCMAARGLWMEMLCLMHEAEPCGYLTLNGKPVTDRQLASLAGASVKDVCAWLSELEESGVFSRDEDGKIFSRRILRDVEKEATDKANGKRGGNPSLKRGVNPSDKSHKPEARSHMPDTATAPKGAAAAPPPLDHDEFRLRCVRAAGRSYRQGWGKILDLRGAHSDERIVTIIEAQAETAKKRDVSSWAWFAAAIDDEHRETPQGKPPPPEPTIWIPAGHRFMAANVALRNKGLPAKESMAVNSKTERGAYFPAWAAEAATEDAA